MERRELPDDERYPRAPLPPHERTWRHPSEVGQATWVRSEPPVAIGRGLLASVSVVGTLIAVGVMWAVLTTDPGAAGRRSAGSPLESFGPLATLTDEASPLSPGAPVLTVPTFDVVSTVAPTRAPHTPATRPSANAVLGDPASSSAGSTVTSQPDASHDTSGPLNAHSPGDTSVVMVDEPADTVAGQPVTGTPIPPPATQPSSERFGTVMEPALSADPLSLATVTFDGRDGSPAVAVPILDGHIALVSSDHVDVEGGTFTVQLDGGSTTAQVLMVDTHGLAIVVLDDPAADPSSTGPAPRRGAVLRVAVDGEGIRAVVTSVADGSASLDSPCPSGAPVLDRRQRLVGFCDTSADGDRMILTTAVAELATAVEQQAEQPAESYPDSTPAGTTVGTAA